MAIQIQIRRDTAANWTSVDPILAEGEFGLETDTNQMKIGDGVLAWTALAYFGGGGNPFDQDLNTTDPVVFAGLTNNAIIYPTSDGTAGQSIVTDGAGNLSFASAANPFDQDLNTTDPVVFAGLTNNAIIYPTSDGTVGQSIVTDGAGNLSFGSAANPFDQDLNTTDPVVFDKVTLTGPMIEQQSVAVFSSGTLTLNCNIGNVFTHYLTANVTTVNITNIPISGSAIGATLILTADGTQRTITWPASFVWSGGVAPTLTSTLNEKDVIVFMTYDAGTTFLAFVAGTSSISGVVTSVTGTSPMVSSGGTTPAISIPAATNASAGYATAAHIAAIEANTAKVTNATHTGDATGSTALTVVAINGVLMSGLATGILRNTTSTGVPSIAIAADFPTLNQNTTGSAATVTTNANLTGVITSVGNATSIASQTGTGTKFVVDTSPLLVTPTIGAATATTVNKITITAPATGSTLTIQEGFTLTANGNATVSGTNTGDDATNSKYSGLVSNATHTGDATGDTALAVVAINGVVMSGLATGLLKNTTSTGVPSIATAGTDYVVPSGAIGTPSSGTLTSCTGLPISTGVSGLGTNIATFLATPSSANLAAALTDQTGTGANVFATSPTLVTPLLGTPTSGVMTNVTGTASGLTAGNVTTNANLTGHITSVGNAAVLGSFTSAQLLAALTDETGSGLAVFATSPTLTTATITSLVETKTAPAISSGTLTLNCSLGNVFQVALNAAITTLTISNIPTTGNAFGITLAFTMDGTARAVTWPAAVKWSGGTAPTLTSTNNKVDIFVLTTWDGGTTWYAMVGGQNF